MITCCEEGFVYIVSYSNSIMTDNVRNKFYEHRRYEVKKRKRRNDFDIINDMSEYLTLIQLMDNLGNVSHAVTMSGVWIFITNKKRDTPLIIEYLALICVSHSD